MYRKQKNEQDIKYILDHLRNEDIEELKLIHGEDYKNIVLNQIMTNDFDVIVGISKKENIPICMGGIWHMEKDGEGVAAVWLLSTDKIKDYKHCLLRELKKEFAKCDKQFWFLYNFIYSKNILAKSWLKGFGFRFVKPKMINIPDGFELFYRIRKCKGLLED